MNHHLIPQIIHQTYSSATLPKQIEQIVANLKSNNPDWEYRFYDNNQCSLYILQNYNEEMLTLYNSINPSYGAAKADLFRYLVLYKEGGVYFDIKSTCTIPLSDLIKPTDEFFISNWPNQNGEFKRAGLKIDLWYIPGGEYQQWYMIAKPNSPFLKAVIDRVVNNIRNYNPWKYGVAKGGVLRVTGPVAYTLAIHPLRNRFPHRYARSHNDFSLKYTMLEHNTDHVKIMKNHYSLSSEPIIMPKSSYEILQYKTFIIARFLFVIIYELTYKIVFRKTSGKLTIHEEFNALTNNLRKF